MSVSDLPSDLISHLRLNQNDDKAEVARQKILKYHFHNGEKNVEEFVGMELKVLPREISWVGRNVDGLALLYNLLQSMPRCLILLTAKQKPRVGRESELARKVMMQTHYS